MCPLEKGTTGGKHDNREFKNTDVLPYSEK